MITLPDYLMGRDALYPESLADNLIANAERLLPKINALLTHAAQDGVYPGIDSRTGTPVASGWRPPHINDRTANAAKQSTHLTMNGIDVQDTADRSLARWCLLNLPLLEKYGLWMEDPQWTGGADPWVHLQQLAPGSGRRVYRPTQAPPLAAALVEQGGTA